MGEIIYLPSPVEPLSAEQRDHWHKMAAYWAEHEEFAQTALEYAQRQRESCLRMLGMLATERGLDG